MFTLTPLAVALQGIGFATLLTALQGLLAVTIAPGTEDPPRGSLAPIKPRHRTRRWSSLAAVPLPLDLLAESERQDEELLFELGVL